MSLSGFLSKILNWPIRGLWLLFRVLLITWATLAIYYSNLPFAGLRVALAMSFAALDMAALAVARSARACGLHRAVSRRGCLVAIHFSFSRSTVASRSRRNAAGDD